MTQHRSPCPVSSTLDLIGDRWSLLVVRSLMVGARRYSDLLAMPEKIATNILADRLKRLEAAGIVARSGRGAQVRYALTPTGAALLPVIQALADWGRSNIEGRWKPALWFREATPDTLIERLARRAA